MGRSFILAVALLLAGPASAHTGVGEVGGFAAGLLHPVTGIDHLLAMIAVGMWAAQLGRPLIWGLPLTFPLVMAAGGLLGGMGAPLPAVEPGIAASVLVLGALVALAVRPPAWVAVIVVGAFAIFHGYAHGAELPPGAGALAYGLGFVLATGFLHLVGIAIGSVVRWPAGIAALRAGGAVIGVAGLWLLIG